MADPLTIFVHHDNCTVTKVVVNPDEPVQYLERHLEIPKHRFVFFNNMALVQAFSYTFYNMQNGDHVYVVPIALSYGSNLKGTFFHKNDQSSVKPKEKPNPEKRITSFFRETARIKDMILQKVEGTMSYKRGPLRLLSGIIRPRPFPPETAKIPTVIPSVLKEPSSEALPLIWDVKKEEEEEEDNEEEEYIDDDDGDQ